jgi:hypothetical protein
MNPCAYSPNGAVSLLFVDGLSSPYTISPIGTTTINFNDIEGIIGATDYTITATNAIGCVYTSSLNISEISNGELANATSLNSSSTIGNSCNNVMQANGTLLNYYGATCDELIATVSDSMGGNELGVVTACVTITDSILTYNSQPYCRRWFDITPASQGAADIILYYTQEDFDTYNVYATAYGWPLLPTSASDLLGISNIRISKISGTLGLGTPIVITPTATWNAANNYWSLAMAIDSFSQFYLHGANPNNAPLSIEMVLSGKINDAIDELTWTATDAKNIQKFDVQEMQNGMYKTIATLGASANNNTYHYSNANPKTSNYRIVADATNGAQIFSNIIKLSRATINRVELYPNPATSMITLEIYSTKNTNATIKILDVTGKLLQQIETSLEQGANKNTIDLSNLASGTYTVKVSDGKGWNEVMLLQKK